jgi:hypothetical protein
MWQIKNRHVCCHILVCCVAYGSILLVWSSYLDFVGHCETCMLFYSICDLFYIGQVLWPYVRWLEWKMNEWMKRVQMVEQHVNGLAHETRHKIAHKHNPHLCVSIWFSQVWLCCCVVCTISPFFLRLCHGTESTNLRLPSTRLLPCPLYERHHFISRTWMYGM